MQLSTKNLTDDFGGFLGARASVYIDSRTAIEGVVDFQRDRAASHRDYYAVQLKRTIRPSAAGGLFATAGGVVGVLRVDGLSLLTFPPITQPGYREVGGGIVGGIGYERVLARRLNVRTDGQVLFSSIDNFARFSAGVGVPFGPRVSAAPSAARAPAPARAAAPAGSVTGSPRVVVATTDGRELKGALIAMSAATVVIRQPGDTLTLALGDVRFITTDDGIGNGATLGALLGGAIGASLGAIIGHGYDAPYGALFTLAMGGGGVAGGALVGALGDSMIDGRRTLYLAGQTTTVSIRPMVTKSASGVSAVLRW